MYLVPLAHCGKSPSPCRRKIAHVCYHPLSRIRQTELHTVRTVYEDCVLLNDLTVIELNACSSMQAVSFCCRDTAPGSRQRHRHPVRRPPRLPRHSAGTGDPRRPRP